MTSLRALAATWLTDLPHTGVREPYERLLDVRDALHLTSGRASDRLLLEQVDPVARQLGYDDPDELRRDVSLAARWIGHAVDLTVRAAQGAVPQRRLLSFTRRERRPEYVEADHGLIIHGGEVALGRRASASDPLIGLRAGALAASRGLMLSPVTADNLGRLAPALPVPWPAEAREALLEMLSSGAGLVPVWEALDLAGCIVRWIPCWEPIRARPQHNPVHRFTVDRHSVQTVVEAQRHLTQVERPDLLLLSALFHDIGKLPGAGSRHAAVGAPDRPRGGPGPRAGRAATPTWWSTWCVSTSPSPCWRRSGTMPIPGPSGPWSTRCRVAPMCWPCSASSPRRTPGRRARRRGHRGGRS